MTLRAAGAPAADPEVVTTRCEATETSSQPAPVNPDRYRYTVRRRLADQTEAAEASGAA